jgi:hypothetical protein
MGDLMIAGDSANNYQGMTRKAVPITPPIFAGMLNLSHMNSMTKTILYHPRLKRLLGHKQILTGSNV